MSAISHWMLLERLELSIDGHGVIDSSPVSVGNFHSVPGSGGNWKLTEPHLAR